VTDLTEGSHLGEIYDVISSRIVLAKESREFFYKEEQAEFGGNNHTGRFRCSMFWSWWK
jgi:hypothetical protein